MPPKKTQSQSQRQNVIVNIHQTKPATRKRKRKSKPKPTANPFYPERIIIPQLQVKQQPTLDYNKLIDIIQSAQSTRASSNIPARQTNPLSQPTPISRRSSSVAFQEQATAIPYVEPQQEPVIEQPVEKGGGGGVTPLNFDPFQQQQADDFFEKPEPLSTAPSAKTVDSSSEKEQELPPQSAEEVEPLRRTIYNLNDYRKDISTRYPELKDEVSNAKTLDAAGKILNTNLSSTDYRDEWLIPQAKGRERAFKLLPSSGKPTKSTATDFYASLGR